MSKMNKATKPSKSITPNYVTQSPNESFLLYEGDLYLALETGEMTSGRGQIVWRWLPNPTIRFNLPAVDFLPDADKSSELKVGISSPKLLHEAILTQGPIVPIDGQGDYKGIITQPISLSTPTDCDQILFHLPNFPIFFGEIIRYSDQKSSRGRLTLESDDLRLCLDQISGAQNLIKELRDQGGFVLTHVGAVERTDNNLIKYKQAKDILQALHYFFSFVRGFWCTPTLSQGRKGNNRVWERWAKSNMTPWKHVESWFPAVYANRNRNEISELFANFLKTWKTPIWSEPLKNCIHWYIVSNIGAGGVEGSIILTQTALELLGWVYFVEDPATEAYSATKFDDLSAHKKIRNLLDRHRIPTAIPQTQSHLRNEAPKLGASDGPEAITKLRNALVHPKKSKRKRARQVSTDARIEAKELGLWYIEMVLLHLFEYEGEYYSRFVADTIDQCVTKVPWI